MLNSKQKGNRYEKNVADFFEEVSGVPFSRTFASGGQNQKGDIVPVGYDWPFVVEIKNRESWSVEHFWTLKGPVWDWWKKLQSEAKLVQKKPMLVLKKNRFPALVMFNFGDVPQGSLLGFELHCLATSLNVINKRDSYIIIPLDALSKVAWASYFVTSND